MTYVFCLCVFFFFFKQKTAYEMRISDWSSDVCSSDLDVVIAGTALFQHLREYRAIAFHGLDEFDQKTSSEAERHLDGQDSRFAPVTLPFFEAHFADIERPRSEEHTSELQSLMRISYAVFCLKKKNQITKQTTSN